MPTAVPTVPLMCRHNQLAIGPDPRGLLGGCIKDTLMKPCLEAATFPSQRFPLRRAPPAGVGGPASVIWMLPRSVTATRHDPSHQLTISESNLGTTVALATKLTTESKEAI